MVTRAWMRWCLGLLSVSSCTLDGYRFNGRFPDALDRDERSDSVALDSMLQESGQDAIAEREELDGALDATMDSSTDAQDVAIEAARDAVNETIVANDGGGCTSTFDPGALYVSTTGTAAGPGTAEQPFQTIAAALARARASGARTIYLDEGSYVEALTIDAMAVPLALRGGVQRGTTGWRFTCAADARLRTLLVSNTTVGLTITNSTGRIELSSLGIRTRAARAGESMYGLVVRGTNSAVALRDVDVLAVSGGIGIAGMGGSVGGVVACDRLTNCTAFATPARAGNAGTAGTNGTDAAQGMFVATGWQPAMATAGSVGNAGTNGSAGGMGASRSDCFDCAGVAGGTGPNMLRCEGGRTRTGGPGLCGCAGSGGTGGQAGGGGGASIAVFVVGAGAAVDVVRSDLRASNGGAGGAGGEGGAGGTAQTGAMGISSSCELDCVVPNPNACFRTPPEVTRAPAPVAGGSAGGAGGNGGVGGRGGHGGGGPSYSVVTVSGAMVFTDATSTLRFGTGGAPGGMGAATGLAGMRFP